MRTQTKRIGLAVLVLVLAGAWPAAAHTAFLMVEAGSPGNIRIETGFSDGGTGAGMEVVIKEKATGRTLSVHTMPEDGVIEVPMPETPYTVNFDTGPGHAVTKDGPLPVMEEQAAATGAVYLVGVGVGNPAWLTVEAIEVIKAADLVLCYQRTADRLGSLLDHVDPTIAPDDVWPGYGLGESVDQQSAETLDRFQRAAEIRQAAEQVVRAVYGEGKTAVVLAAGHFDTAADWAWLGRQVHDLNPKLIPGAMPSSLEGTH